MCFIKKNFENQQKQKGLSFDKYIEGYFTLELYFLYYYKKKLKSLSQ